ncbi:hypothetical protein C8R46DRAFT_266581 [Mycena filopes]|nr:hypothetical protein C8R46DRAFT_266581 [Mycena filopes]
MGIGHSKQNKPDPDPTPTQKKHTTPAPTPPQSTPTPPAPPPPPGPPPPAPPVDPPPVGPTTATTTTTQNNVGPNLPTDPGTPTTSPTLGTSDTGFAPGQSAPDGDSDSASPTNQESLSTTGNTPSPTPHAGIGAGGAAASPSTHQSPSSTFASGVGNFPVATNGDFSPPSPSASALSAPPGLATAATAHGTNIGAILAGVIVPLFVLLLALAAFLAHKRRKRVCDRRQWERTHAEIADAVAQVGGPATTVPSAWTRFDTASRGDLTAYVNEKAARQESGDPFHDSRLP